MQYDVCNEVWSNYYSMGTSSSYLNKSQLLQCFTGHLTLCTIIKANKYEEILNSVCRVWIGSINGSFIAVREQLSCA